MKLKILAQCSKLSIFIPLCLAAALLPYVFCLGAAAAVLLPPFGDFVTLFLFLDLDFLVGEYSVSLDIFSSLTTADSMFLFDLLLVDFTLPKNYSLK